jgi:glyoxylase-like metal-dependent hydrolase (beta-lactamase superfamily II)
MEHLRLLALVVCLGSFAAMAYAQGEPVFKIAKLNDHLYKLTTDGGGYTVKVIASVGRDGALLVDTGQGRTAEDLKAALETLGAADPRFIINTHAHEEHTGGNVVFAGGPVVIGHESLRRRLTSGSYLFNEFPDYALPRIALTNSLSLVFNGEEIRLIAFPGAHDDGDIIVWFTGSRVVCVGGLSNGTHFPSVDEVGGDVLKYPEVVQRLLQVLPEDVTIIPGHGEDGSMTDFRAFHNMLVKTSGIVRSELASGKDLATLQQQDVLKDWASFDGSYVDRNQWIKYLVNGVERPARKQTIFEPIYRALKDKGVEAAAALYYDLKTNHPDQYSVGEEDVVYIAYKLNQTKQVPQAMRFFEICATEFPAGAYAAYCHQKLADAYRARGDIKTARNHCKEVLKIDPEDARAAAMLKELDPGR